ncbi:colicin V synthesis protein [Xylella fastidiosa]|uniref:colicin V synthesis protein n=1 Tax=Xylella fastidiosa TaxID=2371 RepID=UPI0009835AC7|nr:colicin V synthesis protein [Xylella fastidiosa]ALR08077.2 colicin V synthesis protein [Xylella fastidiosa]WGZ32273.1 colicin V synthesis protein [Xylella fastidiosa subsp. pauca]WGZ34551.1 colicin V synthesis protein [Xylella fastidiosa subsp. pauca]WGZ36836.1 colicin V synthesis protein [Xylella fastidiosa subsp. pauca]
MRELTSIEMNNVSGGDFATRLEASIVGGVAAFFAGSIWGGTRGGDGGGVLGIGSIGQGVGMVYGGIAGAIGGAIACFVLDKNITYSYTTGFMNSLFSGNFAK